MNLRPSVIVAIAMSVVASGCGEGKSPSTDRVVEPIRMELEETFAANAIGAGKPRLAEFDHLMVDAGNPNFIIPCIKIARSLWKRGEHQPSLSLFISISYMSGGELTHKTITVAVRDMELTTHHAQASRKTVLVEKTVDISAAPIDDNSDTDGEVRVVDASPARKFEPGS
jgi:hypothetical protein